MAAVARGSELGLGAGEDVGRVGGVAVFDELLRLGHERVALGERPLSGSRLDGRLALRARGLQGVLRRSGALGHPLGAPVELLRGTLRAAERGCEALRFEILARARELRFAVREPVLGDAGLAGMRERLFARGDRGGHVAAHGVDRRSGVLGRGVELGRQLVELRQRAELHDPRERRRDLRASLRELGCGGQIAQGRGVALRQLGGAGTELGARVQRERLGELVGRELAVGFREQRGVDRRREGSLMGGVPRGRDPRLQVGRLERGVQLSGGVAQGRRVLHEAQRRIARGLGARARRPPRLVARKRGELTPRRRRPRPRAGPRTRSSARFRRSPGRPSRARRRSSARGRRTRCPRGRSRSPGDRARSPRSRRAGGSRRPGRPARSRRPPAARARESSGPCRAGASPSPGSRRRPGRPAPRLRRVRAPAGGRSPGTTSQPRRSAPRSCCRRPTPPRAPHCAGRAASSSASAKRLSGWISQALRITARIGFEIWRGNSRGIGFLSR